VSALSLTLTVLAAFGISAPVASARALLEDTLAAKRSVDRSCGARLVTGSKARVHRRLTAPATGWIEARLSPVGRRGGDWDVAVFNRSNRRLVAASAGFESTEVASGPVIRGEPLVVQACRRKGRGRVALDVAFTPTRGGTAEIPSIVRVSAPSRARRQELVGLGLDLTEHATKSFVDVVLHGAADARKLRRSKFIFRTLIGNVLKADARQRSADRRFAARVRASALPSGRTTYRRLADYEDDMKKLVRENPKLVRPFTLPFKTYEGRTVSGIEITEDVGVRDGKPRFYDMGLHHAREWPSGEHTIEWAFELVKGYKSRDARTRRLVRSTRTLFVPVVNPDGFNASREAGELQGAGGGRGGDETMETANVASHPNEYRRKNCRFIDDSQGGSCVQPSAGLAEPGVDPNRNYGALWGGPGASSDPTAQDYRGPGPFSEPETQNMRYLLSKHQATMGISNHTFSNLVLRPPGVQTQGLVIDEKDLKAVGDAMARQNGYLSQFGFQLYDTTGTTDDWSYLITGGYAYTFEIGPKNFHPPFAEMVAEWEGTTAAAKGGKGNREAYYIAQETTANPSKHSVLTGRAPDGAVLRLKRTLPTPTSPIIGADGVEGAVRNFTDTINTTMVVPRSGRYTYHLNPSTRPLVAKAKGRVARGRPSGPKSFQTNGPAATTPCAEATAPPPSCYELHLITVPRGPGIDNARATVRIEWNTPVSDWDMDIFRANAQGQPVGEPIGSSKQGTTNFEETTLSELFLPDRFVVRVINYAAVAPADGWTGRVTFGGPAPYTPAKTETWTFTCEGRGKVGSRMAVTIKRGERRTIDFGAACARVACLTTRGGIRGKKVGPAALGRTRSRQRRLLRSRRLKSRRGIDRYCVSGGSSLRIGYPVKRFSRRLSRSTRRRIRKRAILIITSSKRFRLKGVRVGTGLRTMRRRLRRERRVKVGRSAYYVVSGRRARLLFRVRGGRVRDIGIADKRLTRTPVGARRLLVSWGRRP
jgi:zinc carboxypeptidase